jgi:hypothetical protein
MLITFTVIVVTSRCIRLFEDATDIMEITRNSWTGERLSLDLADYMLSLRSSVSTTANSSVVSSHSLAHTTPIHAVYINMLT